VLAMALAERYEKWIWKRLVVLSSYAAHSQHTIEVKNIRRFQIGAGKQNLR
jgi:hypothetical protein